MLNIENKYKKEIVDFQKEIEKQSLQQDKKFQKICKKLKIDVESNMANCLFDYIYNGCEYCVEFIDVKNKSKKIY
jgi:hypothetical protein